MTATATTTTTAPDLAQPNGLRSLHLVRAGFSLAWVAILATTSASLASGDDLSALAAVLLVAYPLWDVAATLLERRLTGSADRVGTINVGIGLVAVAAMAVAVLDGVGAALLVFGVWALLAGAVQLVVAIRRRHTVGAQWPMMLSGGISVVAGAAMAASSGSSSSDPSTPAGYAAFGAFWFLVSAVALTVRGRRAASSARSAG